MSLTLPNPSSISKIFLTSFAELDDRWDPNYYRSMTEFRRRMKDCAAPVKKLKESLALVQYGISERATEEAIGVPMLRMLNLQDDSWDLSDLKYIELSDAKKKPYLLKHGDILFNRTNSKELVGKCGVFNLKGDWVFASYLIRVRLNEGSLLPSYLTAYLSSTLGRIQIDAVSRQIAGMTNINAEEIRSFLVPYLTLEQQQMVVAAWKSAIGKRDQTLEEARSLLTAIDDILLDELGIPRTAEPPKMLERRMFAREFLSITGERFDPHYHRPEFENLGMELRQYPHATLRTLVEFSTEQWDQKSLFDGDFPYIEIGAVDPAFGRLSAPTSVPLAEAANRAKMLVRAGDLLVSLTRPTRRAICFVPESLPLGVASNGFCVIRNYRDASLDRRYLFHVLRSSVCAQQFDQRSSGGNYPAITEEQLSKVVIPLAEPSEQCRIANLLDERYAQAEKLYVEANAALELAKRNIEAMILGNEAAA